MAQSITDHLAEMLFVMCMFMCIMYEVSVVITIASARRQPEASKGTQTTNNPPPTRLENNIDSFHLIRNGSAVRFSRLRAIACVS